ncbi:hypothetical protein L9F63_024322, partial [Diploptera punctata]
KSPALRPNSEYHVAVTTQMISQPVTVIVGLGGMQYDGKLYNHTQTTTVEPYSTQVLEFNIPDLGPGSYNLTVRGIDGLLFINSTTLDYVQKSYSIFIQTDKAMYKPGQKVQFRVIVLDSHLKPSPTEDLDLYISDGKQNRVKQWAKVQTNNGVYSGELHLSEFPVLGDWTITVSLLGETSSKSFEVAEYVLPKFEVTVDAPEHVTYKDSHFVATVEAKYTYGKAVEGEVTATVNSGSLQPISLIPVSKVVHIDGKVAIDFDIAKDLRLNDQYDGSLEIQVVVEEALTGRKQNTTFEVSLHKFNYKLEIINSAEYFKPGLMHTVHIQVSHYDGSPVQDQKNPVIVKYGFSFNFGENVYKEEEYTLSTDGLVEVNIYPPTNSNETALTVSAKYLDLDEVTTYISPILSPSNTFIQAVLVTQNPK